MRQFVSECMPDHKGYILVEGKKAKHLISVLRASVGDMLYARLPNGVLQSMTVSRIEEGRKSILLQIAGEMAMDEEEATFRPFLNIWLFQFIAKPAKMDLIVRQATECGVLAVVPVCGTFCQNGFIEAAKKKTEDERWNRIVIEAREQSGSPVETRIFPCATLQQAISIWESNIKGNEAESLALVLYEQAVGTLPLCKALSTKKGAKSIALFVGAEGGISREEINYLQKKQVIPVHFATNILRCETAALYGVASVQSVLMET